MIENKGQIKPEAVLRQVVLRLGMLNVPISNSWLEQDFCPEDWHWKNFMCLDVCGMEFKFELMEGNIWGGFPWEALANYILDGLGTGTWEAEEYGGA